MSAITSNEIRGSFLTFFERMSFAELQRFRWVYPPADRYRGIESGSSRIARATP